MSARPSTSFSRFAERIEAELGRREFPFTPSGSFAGQRGRFLVYDPAADKERGEAPDQSCRVLELVGLLVDSSPELRLRFDSLGRFGLGLSSARAVQAQQLISALTTSLKETNRQLSIVSPPLLSRPRLSDPLLGVWRHNLAIVDEISDALGRGVDSGIREVVTALLSSGFRTVMSCEGHLGHGEHAPWVMVGWSPSRYRGVAPAPAARRLRAANRRLAAQLERVVSEFNTIRPGLPAWQRLIVEHEPTGEAIATLAFYGSCRMRDRGWQERRRLLREFQREMLSFARFLTRKLEVGELPSYLWYSGAG